MLDQPSSGALGVPSQYKYVVDTQDSIFLLMLGACFVVFAGPFGRSLANQMEGEHGSDERARDAWWSTLVARVIGVVLVAYTTWKLLNP